MNFTKIFVFGLFLFLSCGSLYAETLNIAVPMENYMGISPKRPDARKLAEMFNQGIKKLRNTGQLNTILSGYGLMDWKK